MQTKLALIAVCHLLSAVCFSAFAQGTAFTYQGRLNDGTNPASGIYDLRFAIYDAATVGTQQGNLLTNSAVAVTNGLFTVTLDFGGQFPGANRWLQTGVRTNGGGAFTTLSPRQQITPAPYAVTAGNLTGPLPAGQLSGAVPSANLSGTYSSELTLNNAANSFTGSGAGLTSLDASQLTSGTVPDAQLAVNVARTNQVWLLGGNADANPTDGNFIGTSDNQPLEIKVNGARALRIEPGTSGQGAPNIIAGSPRNFVAAGVVGATIAGGGAINYFGDSYTNQVVGDFGTVVGGLQNTASGFASTAMGESTTASGPLSTAMGYSAKANHLGSFVWGDSQFGDFASTANNQFSIRAGGGVRLSDNTPAISFGTTTRQMLNLYSTGWGIGVQNATLYARSGGRFSWFVGGSHSDAENNPGFGGTTVMSLTTGGLTVNGTFVSASDRGRKENFKPVDSRAVLEKVAALPLSQWNYKDDEDRTAHLGPMAQDFYAAFNVGPDDKHIATVDADGVALAAIQGLNQIVKEKDGEIKELKKSMAELKELVSKLARQQNGGAR